MAATLAAGGALSHRSAAALWLLRPSTYVEISAPGRHRRGAIRAHRLPLPADEVTEVRGIPVTTVPRTLFDLASVLARHQVERAIEEAEIRGLRDPLSLSDLLARYPDRRGASIIRAILRDGARVLRSELEARFAAFLQDMGLPAPKWNVSLLVAGRRIECDCVWQKPRAIVELDGRAIHDTAAAFERDRVRDRMLQARGWRLVRVTWRQLHDDPDGVAYDLRAILNAEVATAPPRRTSQVPSSS
jgi:very-short-patch-repair endonuclease